MAMPVFFHCYPRESEEPAEGIRFSGHNRLEWILNQVEDDTPKKADLRQRIIVVDSVARPQLRNPWNCLPKTQVSANTKVDV